MFIATFLIYFFSYYHIVMHMTGLQDMAYIKVCVKLPDGDFLWVLFWIVAGAMIKFA